MDELLSFYNLSNPKCFILNLGGYLNKSLVVDSEEGKFFLQEIENDFRNVVEEIKVLQYLKEHNFPVPNFLKNKNDNYLTYYGGKKFLLSEFIDGTSPVQFNMLNEAQLKNSARTLAKLHYFLANYEAQPFSNPNTPTQEEALKICQQVDGIIRNNFPFATNKIDINTELMIKRKIKLLKYFNPEKLRKELSKCPKQFVHGDYHGANLIFDENDEVKGVVDWEYFGYDYRIWEVARSMAFICDIDYTGSLAGPMDLEKAKKYLQAYDKINPLTEEEIKIIPELLEYQAICCVFSIDQHYLKKRYECDVFLPKKPENWFWFVDNKDKIDKEVASKIRND